MVKQGQSSTPADLLMDNLIPNLRGVRHQPESNTNRLESLHGIWNLGLESEIFDKVESLQCKLNPFISV